MEHMDYDGKFYSIKEFATKLGVHPNTIRNAIKSKRISALKIGTPKKHIYRIPHNEIARMFKFDLDEYIEKIVEQRLKG